MEKSNNMVKLLFVLPLIISMSFVGLNNLSNAQNAIQPDQSVSASLFPVIGYAELTLNGQPLDGDVDATSIGQFSVSDNFIEFYTYRHEMTQDVSNTNQRHSTRITQTPIIITKSIDATSPLFIQGLVQNQEIEGTLYFFENDPSSGTMRLRYRIEIVGGRISSVRTFTVVADNGISQVIEEVSFTYRSITWEDVVNNIVYNYDATTG